MSKYSSFKSHQLITENWRKFLKEGLYDAGYESAIGKVNALWSKLNAEGTLVPMGRIALAAAAGLDEAEAVLLDELGGLNIGGVYWNQTGKDEFTPVTHKIKNAMAGESQEDKGSVFTEADPAPPADDDEWPEDEAPDDSLPDVTPDQLRTALAGARRAGLPADEVERLQKLARDIKQTS